MQKIKLFFVAVSLILFILLFIPILVVLAISVILPLGPIEDLTLKLSKWLIDMGTRFIADFREENEEK